MSQWQVIFTWRWAGIGISLISLRQNRWCGTIWSWHWQSWQRKNLTWDPLTFFIDCWSFLGGGWKCNYTHTGFIQNTDFTWNPKLKNSLRGVLKSFLNIKHFCVNRQRGVAKQTFLWGPIFVWQKGMGRFWVKFMWRHASFMNVSIVCAQLA